LRSAVVTAATVLGVIGAGTAPAHAATDWDRCPKGKVCLFSGDGGTGAMVAYSSPQASLGSWDNKAASVYNRTGNADLCMYSLPQFSIGDPHKNLTVCSEGTGNDKDDDLWGSYGNGLSMDHNLSSIRWGHTMRQAQGQPEYLVWNSPHAIYTHTAHAFADLNQDGSMDLLQRTWNGHLWFLKGDGTGMYVGSGWNQMTALTRHGDFSGDGHEDLLARDGSGKLWIYPGNGKGWFGARKLIGTGWNQMTALQAAGDMNSDGHDDLLARDSTGRLWIYPGDGHGRYGERKLIGTGWNQMRAFAAPGDLNGDGHNDLVVSDAASKLWIYPGDGHGRYGTRRMIGAGGWWMFPTVIGIGNVDDGNPGVPDLLAVGKGYQGLVRVYFGSKGGTIDTHGDYSEVDNGDTLL
jgi:hypothetical protein